MSNTYPELLKALQTSCSLVPGTSPNHFHGPNAAQLLNENVVELQRTMSGVLAEPLSNEQRQAGLPPARIAAATANSTAAVARG